MSICGLRITTTTRSATIMATNATIGGETAVQRKARMRRRNSRLQGTCCLIATGLMLTFCGYGTASAQTEVPTATQTNAQAPKIAIGPGDMLNVDVFDR